MQTTLNSTHKVTRKELQNKIGCCYATAKKEYHVIMSSLDIKYRNYLTLADLQKYGL